MSQYPSPYQPPQPTSYNSYLYAWEEYRELTMPARRAGNLMFVLGGLGLVIALSCLGASLAVPWDRLPPEMVQTAEQFRTEYGIAVSTFMLSSAITIGVPSLLLVLLGIFVRRASKAAIYTSIVLVGLILLVLALNILSGLAMIARVPQTAPQAIFGTCTVLIPTVLFGLLIVWLIQSTRSLGALQEAQARYQQQYWQYLQQHQAYGQPYGTPSTMQPPPPPPPSSPPAMMPPPPVPHSPPPPPEEGQR